MRRWRRALACGALVVTGWAAPALGSGEPYATPTYIPLEGGTPLERQRLAAGRAGVVFARAPETIRFAQWRLLRGMPLGAAGTDLIEPCCTVTMPDAEHGGVYGWFEARKLVPGAATSPAFLLTERAGPDYSLIPNCLPNAFDVAAATLRNRVNQHGAGAPAVKAWLATQDAVFASCHDADVRLPEPIAGAPGWLRADRQYQEAAFTFYVGRNVQAAQQFAAIAQDRSSPWARLGLYLRARALLRQALQEQTRTSFASARAALIDMWHAPPGNYGRSKLRPMARALDYYDRPQRLLARLDAELSAPQLPADARFGLHDYLMLAVAQPNKPEAADWIATIGSDQPAKALDHARARWRATRLTAWLVASLALVEPNSRAAPGLIGAAQRVLPGHPAWLTVQVHLIRLTTGKADPAALRAKLDAILARPDLTLAERNLFLAERSQVASDLSDFARMALRRPRPCTMGDAPCEPEYLSSWRQTVAIRGSEAVGFGEEARAIIDRMPLAMREALGRDPQLPRELRLDVAATSFARAVQLQNDAGIDRLAVDLTGLLPQIANDWRAIAAARAGDDKRFAELFAMAKIPGLRTDLADYHRPQGTVRQFQGYWANWLFMPSGTRPPAQAAPGEGEYQADGNWQADLTCRDKCGVGGFPLHMPRFIPDASAERAFLVRAKTDPQGNPEPVPVGAAYAWEELLRHAVARPQDVRSPEALYWLVRIARWGGSHDRLGRRAFVVLHQRYPGSAWAKRTPFYFD